MLRIVFDEVAAQPFDVLRVSFRLGQRALDQLGYAVADKIAIGRELVLGIAVSAQRVIGARRQIVDRIEQRPVKVEYNQFGIHENQIYPAKVAFCRELS